MRPERTTIDVLAGRKRDGEAVFEEVLVDYLGPSRYQIIATPGLVLGVARSDIVTWDESTHRITVDQRGGYIAVQVYGSGDEANRLAADLEPLDAVRDGSAGDRLTVFSVPVSSGFSRLEEVLNAAQDRDSELEWYYGNVYADDGITPLKWWT